MKMLCLLLFFLLSCSNEAEVSPYENAALQSTYKCIELSK